MESSAIIFVVFSEPRQCDNGDLRLLGGSVSTRIGRIEICDNHKWGAVCDVEWDDQDAKVACRQLGYEGKRPELIMT